MGWEQGKVTARAVPGNPFSLKQGQEGDVSLSCVVSVWGRRAQPEALLPEQPGVCQPGTAELSWHSSSLESRGFPGSALQETVLQERANKPKGAAGLL